MKLSRLIVPAAIAFAAFMAGCESSDKDTHMSNSSRTNSSNRNSMMCPGCGHQMDGAAMHNTMYRGENVGFCCAACKDKFNGMTDAQKEKAMMAMKKSY